MNIDVFDVKRIFLISLAVRKLVTNAIIDFTVFM
jgi:hypothetical protein